MSIVAWDGKMMAADKRMVNGTLRATCTKIRKYKDGVLAWVGGQAAGLILAEWFLSGQDEERYPKFQEDDETACRLIVWDKTGIFSYESQPERIYYEDTFHAWGCGRDFAMAAMALGLDAIRAVETACRFDVYCGDGIDSFTMEHVCRKERVAASVLKKWGDKNGK